jgi:DNA replication protein DnaC
MVVLLHGLHRGRAVRAVRRLHRLYLDYPTEPVRQALATAIEFGLSDLDRIEQARLPERWALATFPFDRQPGVDPGVIRQVAELDFIAHAQNLVFIDPTGVGKTGLASAILLLALENGHYGLLVRAQDLLDEMGYLNLRPEQTNIFFKLMEERYWKKATIITTNLNQEDWYAFLGQKQTVAALLDRLRHHCLTIRIDGPSLRTPTG